LVAGANAREFMYATYYHHVQRKVEPIWARHLHESPPPADPARLDYVTRVNVSIGSDGSLKAIEVAKSAGPEWDQAVLAAFRESAPFENPAVAMLDSSGLLHLDDLGFIVSLRGGSRVRMYGDPRTGK